MLSRPSLSRLSAPARHSSMSWCRKPQYCLPARLMVATPIGSKIYHADASQASDNQSSVTTCWARVDSGKLMAKSKSGHWPIVDWPASEAPSSVVVGLALRRIRLGLCRSHPVLVLLGVPADVTHIAAGRGVRRPADQGVGGSGGARCRSL